MQTPLQLTFHGLDHSDALEQRVRAEVDRLERVYQRIIGCRVVIESPHHHHRKGRLYQVTIDVQVPGGEMVVKRHPENHAHEDPFVAVRDAFVAARKQLVNHHKKRN